MQRKSLKCFLIALIVLLGMNLSGIHNVKAGPTDTVTFRIIATGDLHGQVTAYYPEASIEAPENGLSKIATLVNRKRSEVGSSNSLLVDAGDFLRDYTSDYLYDHDRKLVQPIMRAMSAMKYDYITLGNHEFDYPWDYLSNQLTNSGLADKVLVCNTVWHDSRKDVFAPSTVITKKLTTASGKTVPVKIGIIGSTTNRISTRRGDYVNVIDAENNYQSIVAEADRLKQEENADLVIVILHGGIGTNIIGKTSDNIGYALTKVDSVDAIVTAHTHEAFPDPDNTTVSINNADQKTGCINGKPVLAASSHGKALGMIDLKLEISSDNKITIENGKASVEYVTKDTKENRQVTDIYKEYKSIFAASSDHSSYKLASGVIYHNYDTVLQDSSLFQLLNNAKLSYALTYVNENLPDYKNMPIIACTRNLLDYDTNGSYLSISDNLTPEKVSIILSESAEARPSPHLQMFLITGKNLREWLEYNASMYASEGTVFNKLLKNYTKQNNNVSTLLRESSVYNWNPQYIFDGISYSIDLTKKARYNENGAKLSITNSRIVNLTYNGVKVTDSQQFILITDSGVPNLPFLPKEGDASIKNVRDYETGKNVTLEYIKELSNFGSISLTSDHNWSLSAGKNYSFLLGVPKKIADIVSKYSWNQGLAAETATYAFFKGKLPAKSQTINIIAAQGRTELSDQPVPVVISATSRYSIREISYLPGKVKSAADLKWETASIAKNNSFTVNKNGIYTVRATDAKGNHSISYIKVDRYQADILASPKLNPLTNRQSELTGTAAPGSTIHAAIGASQYTSITAANGTFRIEVNPPKAFDLITVYAEANNRKSSVVTANVRKTGPDAVRLDQVRPGDSYVNGTTDEYTSVYALIWKTVYVGRGQTKTYMASDFYNASYKIVETDITVDAATGKFRILLPALKSNMNVFVYAVDRFGVTSRASKETAGY